jgi:hypothetical protein
MVSIGSTITFAPEEKVEFNPHFSRYIQKMSTLESIKEAFKDDVKKYDRYVLYHNALIELLQLRKAKKCVADLSHTATQIQAGLNDKAILTQSIKHRTDVIKASRVNAMEPALKLSGALRS